jgi:hypothetical protein
VRGRGDVRAPHDGAVTVEHRQATAAERRVTTRAPMRWVL